MPVKDRRPTHAEINLKHLTYNLNQIKERVGADIKILAVVKADAYGHGAYTISSCLEKCGIDFLGVAYLEEAVELKKAGIKTPILILGGIFPGQEPYIAEYDLVPVIFDSTIARNLSRCALEKNKKISVHVKIDTGMGRLGIVNSQVKIFLENIKTLPNITISGILSHLAVAESDLSPDLSFTKKQIDNLKQAAEEFSNMGFNPLWKHIANSALIINYRLSYFNLVRPGLMLYGASPSLNLFNKFPLLPVMNIKTKVMQLKEVPAGATISYGRTYTCRKKTKIAILPIGYADGFPRNLSNKGEVLIKGKRAKVVGAVCMDMTMIDVTKIPRIKTGDDVVIIGKQEGEQITVEELAKKAETIPYEIFCRIGNRVPRVYID
ncbi:MAG: alanine racemase [Thermodesulfobacteriota bacterium]|nr:alanine racemase [Thermodesulfobacteriota bacterium]